VKRLSRLLMLVLLLAALPLRGYAGELMALCEAHHGGVAASQEHVHEHGGSYHDDSGWQCRAGRFCVQHLRLVLRRREPGA